jgi:ABC-type polysaccharide transport system permease subunit
MAILISEVRWEKAKRIIQTATSLPNFTSWIIIFAVSFSFFSVDDGLINNLLIRMNLIKEPWNLLGNVDITWYFQTALSIWKSLGWMAIIYIGAIAGIDQELYEAARVDGAGRLRQIIHITVPGIMPTFAVLLFLSIGWMLSGTSFEQIYVFHNALVHDKIQTLDYYVYSVGLKNFNFSLATAVGIFKTLVSVVLLMTTGLISKKLVGRSII